MTVTLRPARSTDAGKIGAILSGFLAASEWMPDLHTGAEDIAFCGDMIDRGWVTVATQAEVVIGFIARDGEEICALYVGEQAQGRHVGHQLLDDAKARAERLELQVFQANTRAQKFYSREGFCETGRGDGAGNEEGLPDIAYVWNREGGK